ncbi:hypothetical protein E1A91_A09G087300v1 [Gossypium mustelinum]|uniref:Uncharacterized protein n=2 Tax=Gossypium TaxID=3633 RepID=A0A5D2XVM6_GOSMU|nr:hypothetical protein ES332_A09G097600v1 [Gossypium tomentosum]TYJ17927.1 hypothetical protein E1A91_A09G087300v1 [Gossypium mustelinum]
MGYWIKGGSHHQNRSVVDEPAVGKSGSQSPTLSPFCLETTPIPSLRSRLWGFCFSICFSPMVIHRTKEPTLLFPRRTCQLSSHQMQEESWIFCWYVSV